MFVRVSYCVKIECAECYVYTYSVDLLATGRLYMHSFHVPNIHPMYQAGQGPGIVSTKMDALFEAT